MLKRSLRATDVSRLEVALRVEVSILQEDEVRATAARQRIAAMKAAVVEAENDLVQILMSCGCL